MTLTVEPIVSAGSKDTILLPDGWTMVTVDNSLAAQFEHTMLVTEDGCEILTNRTNL
jgi:methionyl aminopeptidase